MNIICFGFGQVAKNFIKKLKDQGVTFKLTTTSREESNTKEFENINYESFQFTEEVFDKNLIPRFEEADHILLSIALGLSTPNSLTPYICLLYTSDAADDTPWSFSFLIKFFATCPKPKQIIFIAFT